MEEWAGLVQSSNPAVRVAGLIGADVRQDPGMPVRLALRDSAPVQMAAADPVDPAPVAIYAPPPPAASAALVDELLAAATPSPVPAAVAAPVAEVAAAPTVQPVAVPASAPAAQAGQEIVFVSNPVIQPLRSAVAMVAPLASPSAAPAAAQVPSRSARTGTAARADSAPAAAAAETSAPARAAPSGPVRTSGWAVQLGAYDSVGVARDGWARASRSFAAELAGLDAITTSATVNGRTVYRLAVTGFDSRADAAAACAALSRRGGSCFVRNIAAGEPVRWASRPVGTRVASR
jgi:hypothetical protein